MKAIYIVIVFMLGFMLGHVLTINQQKKKYHNAIRFLIKVLDESYFTEDEVLPEDRNMADGYNNAIAFSKSLLKDLLNK